MPLYFFKVYIQFKQIIEHACLSSRPALQNASGESFCSDSHETETVKEFTLNLYFQ